MRKQIKELDQGKLFDQLASELLTYLGSLDANRLVLGVCGGRSVGGLLSSVFRMKNLLSTEDWQKLHIFMVDERRVPLTHADSNYRLIHEAFVEQAVAAGLLETSQIHPFSQGSESPEQAATRYTNELLEFGGRFDAVFLGVGEDAHIAGLFPNGPWCEISEARFIAFDGSPKPPAERMTASSLLIKQAGLAICVFLGEAKRAAFERYNAKSEPESECPVAMLASVENVIIGTDLD